jgi:hypothetical protein
LVTTSHLHSPIRTFGHGFALSLTEFRTSVPGASHLSSPVFAPLPTAAFDKSFIKQDGIDLLASRNLSNSNINLFNITVDGFFGELRREMSAQYKTVISDLIK